MPSAALETVLAALIENSRQAGAACVRLIVRREGQFARLLVSDDGPGVAPADRGRLFEPFFMTHRAKGGTGLGLPIARSLIEAHGGSLAFTRTDVGAGFEIIVRVLA